MCEIGLGVVLAIMPMAVLLYVQQRYPFPSRMGPFTDDPGGLPGGPPSSRPLQTAQPIVGPGNLVEYRPKLQL